jgi:hypothetical protein
MFAPRVLLVERIPASHAGELSSILRWSMMDEPLTISFLVVSDLFDRYTIVVNTATRSTNVYCEECDEWVERYDGEQLSQHSPNELYEKIVEDHSEQVLGEKVEIADDRKI